MRPINYIHNNPIEVGLVDEPQDYHYSSARNYLDMVDNVLEVDIIDFGVQEGYIAI